MKVLMVKNLCLIDGFGKELKLERMKVYNFPDVYALELIEQEYAVKFGFLGELGRQV